MTKADEFVSELDVQEAEERRGCAACREGRTHSEAAWKNHPHRGQGCADGVWRPASMQERRFKGVAKLDGGVIVT